MNPSELVKKAEQIATFAHKAQKRWDGEAFITHPAAVAEKVEATYRNLKKAYPCPDKTVSSEFLSWIVAIAWLHDVIEDTDWTITDLEEAGFPDEVLDAVAVLTHMNDEPYYDYILRVKENSLATIVKLADLEHNIESLKHHYEKKGKPVDKDKLAKYQLSRWILEH